MKSTIRSDVVVEDEADGEDVEEEVDETDGEDVAEEVEEAGVAAVADVAEEADVVDVAGADAVDEAEEGDAGGLVGEDFHGFCLYLHFVLNYSLGWKANHSNCNRNTTRKRNRNISRGVIDVTVMF